jgi:hypothetical protein
MANYKVCLGVCVNRKADINSAAKRIREMVKPGSNMQSAMDEYE